jgi:O-antigen ligase
MLRALAGPRALLIVTGPVLSALTLDAFLKQGTMTAIAIAALPLAAVCAALLLTSGRSVLFAAVFVVPLSGIPLLVQPLPLPGASVFPLDVVLLLAVGGWAFGSLIARGLIPPVPRTPVLGWLFVLFALAIITATVRGHYEYGATLFGQPLRLVLYAGIVVLLAGMTVNKLYRLVRALLYGGVVWVMLLAAYYIATGSSQTDQTDLSTGGTRILGISTSLFCASALFFALLSLRLSQRGSARMLHLTVAVCGLFGVVLGFGRGVFAATAVVCVLLLVLSRSVRSALLSVVPLALPFLILIGIAIPYVAPTLVTAARERISSPPSTDANVQWRVEANRAVLAQVREQPLVGVGFGRTSEFYIQVDAGSGVFVPVRIEIGQDPHNGYVYLLAGGGLAALGTFLALLTAYAVDTVRRFTSTRDPEAKLVLLWASATLFTFLVNAATGTAFTTPVDLLVIWLLLVIPAVVPRATLSHARAAAGRVAVGPGSAPANAAT